MRLDLPASGRYLALVVAVRVLVVFVEHDALGELGQVGRVLDGQRPPPAAPTRPDVLGPSPTGSVAPLATPGSSSTPGSLTIGLPSEMCTVW